MTQENHAASTCSRVPADELEVSGLEGICRSLAGNDSHIIVQICAGVLLRLLLKSIQQIFSAKQIERFYIDAIA